LAAQAVVAFKAADDKAATVQVQQRGQWRLAVRVQARGRPARVSGRTCASGTRGKSNTSAAAS
jgi:hypothetical protein